MASYPSNDNRTVSRRKREDDDCDGYRYASSPALGLHVPTVIYPRDDKKRSLVEEADPDAMET
jgi:hypothetical protein